MAASRTASDRLATPDAPAFADAREVLHFTVASALLRELGERLVGHAHIALAELVKNAYDADATLVELSVDHDEIVVSDNGHGMTFAAFRDYWMRIDSPHKQQTPTSPRGRRLTGSKGVGRLSAQFLAHEVSLETSAGSQLLQAAVDWDAAVDAGELTSATADVVRSQRRGAFAGGARHGTRVVLRKLKHDWDVPELELLARELWPLRPPFGSGAGETQVFDIHLSSSLENAKETFDSQMQAILELWDARIVGRLIPLDEDPRGRLGGRRVLQISIELGEQTEEHEHVLERCRLESLDYEIRVFDLRHRQPAGIRVNEAREYMNRFGGVHVYDAGFHLPYYGPTIDWLGIEIAYSHRLSRSRLLPAKLQDALAMQFLPTNSRLWGVVRVDTGREHATTVTHGLGDQHALTIQVTRDRLVDNKAYRHLRDAVRFSVDLYAVMEARKHAQEIERSRPMEALPVKAQRVEEVLEAYRDEIPSRAYQALRTEIREVVDSVQSEAEATAGRAGLLGALATAGMSAVAFEHEFNRQLTALERSLRGLRTAIKSGDLETVEAVGDELSRLLKRARETQRLFSSLVDEEDRTRRISPKARAVLEDVVQSLGPFASPVRFELEALGDVRLPAGTHAEWSAFWQNLVVNAINAMLDIADPVVRVSSSTRRGMHEILLEDNGTGVDLDDAEHLFEPFHRATAISRERRGLGFGGTGLGLTIVRMLAESLNCRVRFVKPRSPVSGRPCRSHGRCHERARHPDLRRRAGSSGDVA